MKNIFNNACRKNSIKNHFAMVAALLLLFSITFYSCSTTKTVSEQITNASETSSNEQISTTQMDEYALSNGIPVYVKENHSNHLVSLYIVVKGGKVFYPPEESGMEMALMRMMKSGSEKYPYETLQSVLYKTHADFFGFAQTEGSGLGIECIDYYLDQMLPILADGFLNPAYGQNEFDTMKKEYAQRIQSTLTDPMSLIFYTASKELYKNHPYQTSSSVTEESFDNITVENLKKAHTQILDASRISIVVTGNISGKKITKKLNSLFGDIPVLEQTKQAPQIPQISVAGEGIVLSRPAAQGSGFMIECFPAPPVDSDDYIPAVLAANLYSDVLYQVVREEHGACYTPSSQIISSKAPFGVNLLYRVSDVANAAAYVQEAQKIMEGGNLIIGRNPDNSYIFAPISDRLESCKNVYLNSEYEQVKTNSGSAGRIASSIFTYNSPTAADLISAKIRAVTADDIERVFKTYFTSDQKRWFAVVGPENETNVKF